MIPWYQVEGRFGAYAQAEVVRPEWIVRRPPELDAITGATVPLNALTASQELEGLGLAPGATLLITGASGAVGSYATQLAVAAGLRVWAIASEGDEEWVGSLGAAEVLPRSIDLEKIEPVDALFDAVPIGAEATVAVKRHGAAVFTRGVQVAGAPGSADRDAARALRSTRARAAHQAGGGGNAPNAGGADAAVDGRRRGTSTGRAGRPARQDRAHDRIGGEMARIVLVHGAFAGAWCWEPVVPGLRGRRPRGRGDRPARERRGLDPGRADVSLDAYATKICATVAAGPEPVVLVGHSMGGMAITQAAARCPEPLAALVYVAAFCPDEGQSLVELVSYPEAADDKVQANMVVSGDPPVAELTGDGAVGCASSTAARPSRRSGANVSTARSRSRRSKAA